MFAGIIISDPVGELQETNNKFHLYGCSSKTDIMIAINHILISISDGDCTGGKIFKNEPETTSPVTHFRYLHSVERPIFSCLAAAL